MYHPHVLRQYAHSVLATERLDHYNGTSRVPATPAVNTPTSSSLRRNVRPFARGGKLYRRFLFPFLASYRHSIPHTTYFAIPTGRALDTLPTAKANALSADISAVQATFRSGITAQRASAHDKHWDRWTEFLAEHDLQPDNLQDPIPLLQVFGHRYRDGRIAPSGEQVKSRTVEDAIRAVGQTYASMGAVDPRLNHHGKIDFRLTRQLRSYKKTDQPPIRVKPVPILLILHIMRMAHTIHPTTSTTAVADMIAIAFFFLLRPGEYTGTTTDDQPFLLRDVCLHLGQLQLDTQTAPIPQLWAATSVTYVFTTQKNGICNEVLSHGRSGDPLVCPVRATIRRIIHHRQHNSPSTTPLASFYSDRTQRLIRIKADDITKQLRAAATIHFNTTGIKAEEISARSLRAGGAMAMLMGDIDFDVIEMIGRWHGDSMMRYLHLQAQPVKKQMAKTMFNNGQYSFLPTDTVPMAP